MIPVLGIPVLNRGDLLLRCISSIDYPVRRLVIVNNGRDKSVRAAIEQVMALGPECVGEYRVKEEPDNLGVAASWNAIMRENPAEYWLLVGNDIQFTDGDLKKMDAFIRAHPDHAVNPANWGHSLFAVQPRCLEVAGWFDENFHPAYLEDSDHMYRINKAGLPWADVPDVHAVHGEAPTWGSHTIYSLSGGLEANRISHRKNFGYYCRKWGGLPGRERFERPFGSPDLPLTYWELDPELRRQQREAWDAIR